MSRILTPLRFWPVRLVLVAGLALLPYVLSCERRSRQAAGRPTLRALETNGGPSAVPTEYLLDSQPFSPTLAHLFDQGRIVAFPPGEVPKPPAGVTADKYSFSAIDRYGRIYHFDAMGRWWMAAGPALPEPLPGEDWDAAWNPDVGAVEVLVTAPYGGQQRVQLLRWRGGEWLRCASAAAAPKVRPGAQSLFNAATRRWILAGGGAGDAWILEGALWKPWGLTAGSPPAPAPDLSRTTWLIDGPDDGRVAVLTGSGDAGDFWVWKAGAWLNAGRVPLAGLCLARYAPNYKQILFVWARGLGQDQICWLPFPAAAWKDLLHSENLNQTALVKINEEDEGLWRGWGRVREGKDAQGKPNEIFSAGFAGPGEPAIRLSGEYGEANFHQAQIKMIEMPPRLEALKTRAAAYVPALEGIMAPSIAGLGIDAQRQPFFPPEASDAKTSDSAARGIDVIQQNYRFWIFKDRLIRWLKPPYEIHPWIDYPNSYTTTDGRRRCLSWSFPEPGLFRYAFYEIHGQKVQWLHSPLLTLKTIPQLALDPQDEVYLCDPVVWGDPAEVIVVGWCGRQSERLEIKDPPEGLNGEAYARVPSRGFMARLSALTPNEWKVTPIAIPFCHGARLMAAPAQNSLYLVGGKTAVNADYKERALNFMINQRSAWRWDGTAWSQIQDEGTAPSLKLTYQVAYDPIANQLLSLTPKTFFGFDAHTWHCLWQTDKFMGERRPEEMGLYVHPDSHTIVGAWFMPEPILRVWKGERWIPVRPPRAPENTPAGGAKQSPQAGGALPDCRADLIPATEPDSFVSIDAARLAAIRMDVRRNREADRQLAGHWLRLLPVGQPMPADRFSQLRLDAPRPALPAPKH